MATDETKPVWVENLTTDYYYPEGQSDDAAAAIMIMHTPSDAQWIWVDNGDIGWFPVPVHELHLYDKKKLREWAIGYWRTQ